MIDAQKDHRLHKLRLQCRTAHGDQRLAVKDWRAFWNRPHIAGKFKIGQIVQKSFAEALLAAQESDILLGKFQFLEIIDDLFQTGHDSETAIIRYPAEKHIVISDLVRDPMLKIAISHGQLVKIGQHGQIDAFHCHFPLMRAAP